MLALLRRRPLKALLAVLLALLGLALATLGLVAYQIYSYGGQSANVEADAAIVLGAAVWTDRPSPVFRERINHAIDLYGSKRVRKLIFTGGVGQRGEPAESAVARDYAAAHGVPPIDILTESESQTTYQNLLYAKRIGDARALGSFLVVSDPLHMKRAMAMAKDLGMEAYPSPTRTTRYRSSSSQLRFLARETYFYFDYLTRSRLKFGKL